MKIIYRISDGINNKNKPDFVTKKDIFMHFIKVFVSYDIYVIADNVSDDTYHFICSYIDSKNIMRTSLSNSKSFLYGVLFVLNNFSDNEKIYFAEDDYIYTKNAPQIIEEGLDIGDYSSGYDHPDKYMNYDSGGPNPFIAEGGEITRVLVSKNRHWKLTNSFCMTFATTVKIIREDLPIYQKYCNESYPLDFPMFIDLITINKRKLVSCIPAVSTHGETQWLAKFVDWEKEFNLSK